MGCAVVGIGAVTSAARVERAARVAVIGAARVERAARVAVIGTGGVGLNVVQGAVLVSHL